MGSVPVTLKNTLRSLRAKYRYSQEDAAARFGVSVPTLRAWEVDSSNLTYREMLKAQDIYNTPIDYIFFGSELAFSELLEKAKEEARRGEG